MWHIRGGPRPGQEVWELELEFRAQCPVFSGGDVVRGVWCIEELGVVERAESWPRFAEMPWIYGK
jgi:hypothetical protein